MSIRAAIKRWYRVGLDWDWFLAEVRGALFPGAVLLDAGAGECKWSEKFPDVQYIGLDAKVGDPTWDFGQVQIEADLNESIPMPDNSVDVVITIQVMEHLNRPQVAAREFARVLKPGGHVFATTPFFYQEHQQPYDFYRYTRYGLRYLFEQAGLEVRYIEPMGGFFMMLRDQLPTGHARRFMVGRPGWQAALLWLPRQISRVLTVLILPPLLYALDKLDTERIHTLGHTVHAVKPGTLN